MNKKESVTCEFEMDFKKSFCCTFNLSNDDIISVSCQCLCCVLWPPPGLKTGMDFRGQVWKRVRKMTFFVWNKVRILRTRQHTPTKPFRSTPRWFSFMVRESKKQSRAKAKQMSKEKPWGRRWKEKAREVGLSSFFVSPSPLSHRFLVWSLTLRNTNKITPKNQPATEASGFEIVNLQPSLISSLARKSRICEMWKRSEIPFLIGQKF